LAAGGTGEHPSGLGRVSAAHGSEEQIGDARADQVHAYAALLAISLLLDNRPRWRSRRDGSGRARAIAYGRLCRHPAAAWPRAGSMAYRELPGFSGRKEGR